MTTKIRNEYKDFTIELLALKVMSGEIDLQPDFQRDYVYDDIKASYLVESILIDMPIPTIYLCDEDETYEVIDGQQRLTTVKRFLNNDFPLKKLKYLPDLNDKYFKDLDKKQKKQFTDFSLKTIIITPDDNNTKYELFERLNTGASSLNAQEIRNCIYRGHFNDLLKELVNDPNVRKYLFKENRINRRMKLEEEVLFLIWFLEGIRQGNFHFTMSKKQAVNKFMSSKKNITEEDATILLKDYKNIFREGFDLFGILMHDVTNRYLIVDVMNSFNRKFLRNNQDEITEIIRNTVEFNEEYISYRTGKNSGHLSSLVKRHNIVKDIIEKLVDEEEIKKDFNRVFPGEWRKELYDRQNSKCAICKQTIHDVAIAEIDHIEPHSLGGQTTIENAQLTHRYCNRSKGNRI
ncbi:MAG: HNH endonuclease family protein [Romboutsia sp.]|uniref:HNH endonuclease family protein n=1 Tax=Romboutsia sp. TaxID=1965302 RepID=UPI003F3074A7